MKTSFKLLLAVCSFMWLQSCYEEYKFDYTHTTAYFARQKPLGTLVEEEGKEYVFYVWRGIIRSLFERERLEGGV